MQQHSFIFVSTLSNKTVDVNHPTVSSELFSQNENKNQNCLEQKDCYQQLYLSWRCKRTKRMSKKNTRRTKTKKAFNSNIKTERCSGNFYKKISTVRDFERKHVSKREKKNRSSELLRVYILFQFTEQNHFLKISLLQ